MRGVAASIAAFGLVMLASLVLATGAAGLLYALVYLMAVAPGVGLGCALFGRRHPAAWIGGALIGYGATQVALWAAMALGVKQGISYLFIWIAQAVIVVVITRFARGGPILLTPWTGADVRALVFVLLLAPLIMTPPYRNLGAVDAEGNRYYRAYFTADFVWHTALAAELGKDTFPPRNPYLASRPIHYYWSYFLLPAIIAHDAPAPLRDVQRALEVNAICTAVLVLGALFMLVRAAVPVAWPAIAATMLGVLCASAEGAWFLERLWVTGGPLSATRNANIDAMTAWRLGGLRIDCLPRALWYNPQHSVACALALVALLIAVSPRAMGWRAILAGGVSLGFSTFMNPFVGGVFTAVYALTILWQWRHERGGVSALLAHAAVAIPVALALWWDVANKVLSGAGSVLHLGWRDAARQHAIVSLLLGTGPMLVPALPGLLTIKRLDDRPKRMAAIAVLVSLALMHLVVIGDASWIGFRTGQILLLMLPVLLARVFWMLASRPHGRAWVAALASLIAIAGLPTTVIDAYNAQDITNREMAAGFHWTITLTPRQQEALDWIRTHVPEDAIVQMEPTVRGRDQWSLIPTFGQRRMAAGLPISLGDFPAYAEQSNLVRTMFMTADAREAFTIATRLHIRYVYVDQDDNAAYPAGVAKFRASEYFTMVFDNGEAAVYGVVQPLR